MPKTPGEMIAAIARNLPDRTGKSIEEWVRILKKSPAKTTRERMAWLKDQFGLGGATCMTIVAHLEGTTDFYENTGKLVNDQYSGDRAAMRPLYERLLAMAKRLGKDLRVAPCQTYVPLIRKTQFAIIKATTRTRIDLGLVLPGVKHGGRLLPAKNLGGGDKIKHRLEIASLRDIDSEVERWLKAAYEQNV